MKNLKKLIILALCGIMALAVTACVNDGNQPNTPTPKVFTVTVDDFSLEIGKSVALSPKMSPVGTQATYSYALVSASPEDCVTISNGRAEAHEAGTATYKVTANSLATSDEAFSVTDTFVVTVTAPALEAGEHILNGSFENSFYGWELTPANPENTFKNEVTNNEPHSGVSALNLWSKVGATEGESDALDLVISQAITVEEADDYLFSLWFKGDIGSMSFIIESADETEVINETISPYDYISYAMSDQEGYVHLGVDVEDLQAGSYTVKVHFVAPANNWGFVDDVSFTKGSTEDLMRPTYPEVGEFNFVIDGNISENFAENWEIETDGDYGQNSTNGSAISMWGGKEYRVSQTIYGLDKLDYNAVAKVISSGGQDYKAAEEAYFFINEIDGTPIAQVEYSMPGFNWNRVELLDVELEGDVEIGIYAKFASSAWVSFTGFALYSVGYDRTGNELTDTGLINIKVDGVDVVNDDGALSVELESYARYENLITAKNDASGFVEATAAYRARITSVVFDDTDDILTITVTAESGATKNYNIAVSYVDTGDTRTEVTVSLAQADWTYDSGAAGSLISFSGAGIEYPNNKNTVGDNDPADLVISQTLTGIEEGNWKIVVKFSHEHASIEMGGVLQDDDWASNWDWTSNVEFEKDIVVGANGEAVIEIKLVAGTWSYLAISSITLVPVTAA